VKRVIHTLAKRHLRAAHAATKRHVKRAVHTLTKKKVVSRKTHRHVLRTLLIGLATVSFGSLAYGITMTKPTISVAVKTGTGLEIKAAPSAAPKPQTVAPGNGNVGKASWYALGLPQPDALTCASTTYPRGTYLHVRHIQNGRTVVCRVNDYGPEAWTGRIIDLSRGSFVQIDNLSRGVVMVEVHVVAGPTGTQLNLPIESEIFAAVVGYNSCRTQHTPEYCDAHRQE
jgi:rare lipoprotein A (peptidoglycan hydrolase)